MKNESVPDQPDRRVSFHAADEFRKLYSVQRSLARLTLEPEEIIRRYDELCREISHQDILTGLTQWKRREVPARVKSEEEWHIPMMVGAVLVAEDHKPFLVLWATQCILALERLRTVETTKYYQQALSRFIRLVADHPIKYGGLVDELGLPHKELRDNYKQLDELYQRWFADNYSNPDHHSPEALIRLKDCRDAFRGAVRIQEDENDDEVESHSPPTRKASDEEVAHWINASGSLTHLARRNHHLPNDQNYLAFSELNRLSDQLLADSQDGKVPALVLYLTLITGKRAEFWLEAAGTSTGKQKPNDLLLSTEHEAAWLKLSFVLPQRLDIDERFSEFYLKGDPQKNGLPLPFEAVIKLLQAPQTVDDQELKDYLSSLSQQLSIPRLTVARVERVLYQVLKRWVRDRFIADFLCGTPTKHSPAMNYSNYTRAELFTAYREALTEITGRDESDFSYVMPFIDATQRVGSEILLEPKVVSTYLDVLCERIEKSSDYLESCRYHTVWIWHVLLLLTAARVVSDLPGLPTEVDLEAGLWWASDKEERRYQTYGRYLPLCPFLVKALQNYQEHLLQCLKRHQRTSIAAAQFLQDYQAGEKPLFAFWDHQRQKWTSVRHKHIKDFNKDFFTQPKNWTRHFSRRCLIKANCPAYLIDAIYGHENAYGELLNPYSSATIADLKHVASVFEDVAIQLSLRVPEYSHG